MSELVAAVRSCVRLGKLFWRDAGRVGSTQVGMESFYLMNNRVGLGRVGPTPTADKNPRNPPFPPPRHDRHGYGGRHPKPATPPLFGGVFSKIRHGKPPWRRHGRHLTTLITSLSLPPPLLQKKDIKKKQIAPKTERIKEIWLQNLGWHLNQI